MDYCYYFPKPKFFTLRSKAHAELCSGRGEKNYQCEGGQDKARIFHLSCGLV
jgi:hypothetical protein